MHNSEIFVAEAKQCGSIKLRVAANVIVRVRMERLALGIVPMLLGLILTFEVHQLRIPIGFLARNEVAALENEDLLPRRSQAMCQRSPAGTASNNDDVIMICASHALLLSFHRKC